MNLAIDHLFRVRESEFWQSSRGNLWGQLAFDGNDGSAKRMIRPSRSLSGRGHRIKVALASAPVGKIP